jgi:hypothetical protein
VRHPLAEQRPVGQRGERVVLRLVPDDGLASLRLAQGAPLLLEQLGAGVDRRAVGQLRPPEQQPDDDGGQQQRRAEGQVGHALSPTAAGGLGGGPRRQVAAQLMEQRIGGAALQRQRVGGAVDRQHAQLGVEHLVVAIHLAAEPPAGGSAQPARGQDGALAHPQRSQLPRDLHGGASVGQRPPQQAALLMQQQVELAQEPVGLTGGRVASVQRQVGPGDQPEQQRDPRQHLGPAPALACRSSRFP